MSLRWHSPKYYKFSTLPNNENQRFLGFFFFFHQFIIPFLFFHSLLLFIFLPFITISLSLFLSSTFFSIDFSFIICIFARFITNPYYFCSILFLIFLPTFFPSFSVLLSLPFPKTFYCLFRLFVIFSRNQILFDIQSACQAPSTSLRLFQGGNLPWCIHYLRAAP